MGTWDFWVQSSFSAVVTVLPFAKVQSCSAEPLVFFSGWPSVNTNSNMRSRSDGPHWSSSATLTMMDDFRSQSGSHITLKQTEQRGSQGLHYGQKQITGWVSCYLHPIPSSLGFQLELLYGLGKGLDKLRSSGAPASNSTPCMTGN